MNAKTVDHNEGVDHNVVRLDGSTGEGGGQILRNAISYCTILQKLLSITKIRAKRSKPGLKAQHVASIQLPVQLAGGTLSGDSVGSSTISYVPHGDNFSTQDNSYVTKDIGTAGSICLLLQASLPCVLFMESFPDEGERVTSVVDPITTRLTLIGGTNAALAPQYDYWKEVFLPILHQQCGLDQDQVEGVVERRGYFPRGEGKVHVKVKSLTPSQTLNPIQLTERGDLESVRIRAFHAGKLPRHLAQTMAQAAQRYLKEHGLWLDQRRSAVEVVTETNAIGSGLGIFIVATTTTGCKLAGSALSSPGKQAGNVGIEAAEELVRAWNAGGCVDEWLQDQLILYMALADGVSEIMTGCLTLHTQTAMWTAEQFLNGHNNRSDNVPLFEVQKLPDDKIGTSDENKDKNTEGKTQRADKRPRHSAPVNLVNDGANYGQEGLIPGRHLIRCNGIGLKRATAVSAN